VKNLLLICKLLLIAEFVMAQSNWSPIGPVGSPSVLPDTDNQDGTGRLHSIAFHPTNANIFYVGTAYGGLWKTTNGCCVEQCISKP
jgi:hypothetical protein